LIRGATLLLRAVLLGHRVTANLWYLITASPPLRAMKRLAGRVTAGNDWPRQSTA
jgi:hypothetical protein